jgi:2-polyprenyl-3-methyl-5-hydroxy-6-metoxy-1,4-benzoquinol methylase
VSITKEYQEELVQMHEHRKWGSSAIRFGGADVLGLVMQRDYIKSVLDFGCGKALMEDYVRSNCGRSLDWTNYDPGRPGIDRLPDGQFDLVITCDVLEHVEPDHITQTIKQIEERTRIVMYNNIACSPTNSNFTTGPHIGKNIHLIVQPPSHWRAQFASVLGPKMELWEYRHCERRKQGVYRPRCTLIHERVG